MEKAREFQKNIYFCFIDYTKAFVCVDHTNKLWKILKEMGVADHLTCLLRNLYVDQEATVRIRHGTTDWFKIGKGVWRDYQPAYLISMQSASCEMLDWMNPKAESICQDKYQQPQMCRRHHERQKVKRNERASWWWWRTRVTKSAWNSTFKTYHHFMANWKWSSGSSDTFYFGLQNHCRWWLQIWN